MAVVDVSCHVHTVPAPRCSGQCLQVACAVSPAGCYNHLVSDQLSPQAEHTALLGCERPGLGALLLPRSTHATNKGITA